MLLENHLLHRSHLSWLSSSVSFSSLASVMQLRLVQQVPFARAASPLSQSRRSSGAAVPPAHL